MQSHSLNYSCMIDGVIHYSTNQLGRPTLILSRFRIIKEVCGIKIQSVGSSLSNQNSCVYDYAIGFILNSPPMAFKTFIIPKIYISN